MAGQQPLRRLGLEEEVVSRMAAEGMRTVGDLFSKTELQLVQALNLNRPDVVELLSFIAKKIAPDTKTAGDLLRERRENGRSFFVATGLPTIDNSLQGGFPAGMITELVGPAGVGKTQSCLMMASQACLPADAGGLGADTGVVYLDTERKFSADRLVEIASTRLPEYYGERCPEGMARLLDQVTVYTLDTSSALLERLESLQTRIIEGNVRLIILDSIAALARRDFSREETVNRQELLTRQAAVLKSLAYTFSAVVLVTNQVTTSFSPSSRNHQGQKQGSIASHVNSSSRAADDSLFQAEVTGGRGGPYIIPALGNTWHHCVSNRLILEQHEAHREIHLTKSPLAPSVSCRFVVRNAGLEEVGG